MNEKERRKEREGRYREVEIMYIRKYIFFTRFEFYIHKDDTKATQKQSKTIQKGKSYFVCGCFALCYVFACFLFALLVCLINKFAFYEKGKMESTHTHSRMCVVLFHISLLLVAPFCRGCSSGLNIPLLLFIILFTFF